MHPGQGPLELMVILVVVLFFANPKGKPPVHPIPVAESTSFHRRWLSRLIRVRDTWTLLR
jgi:hypothetical protein